MPVSVSYQLPSAPVMYVEEGVGKYEVALVVLDEAGINLKSPLKVMLCSFEHPVNGPFAKFVLV